MSHIPFQEVYSQAGRQALLRASQRQSEMKTDKSSSKREHWCLQTMYKFILPLFLSPRYFSSLLNWNAFFFIKISIIFFYVFDFILNNSTWHTLFAFIFDVHFPSTTSIINVWISQIQYFLFDTVIVLHHNTILHTNLAHMHKGNSNNWWLWTTRGFVASTSSTKWTRSTKLRCTKPWSSRRSHSPKLACVRFSTRGRQSSRRQTRSLADTNERNLWKYSRVYDTERTTHFLKITLFYSFLFLSFFFSFPHFWNN